MKTSVFLFWSFWGKISLWFAGKHFFIVWLNKIKKGAYVCLKDKNFGQQYHNKASVSGLYSFFTTSLSLLLPVVISCKFRFLLNFFCLSVSWSLNLRRYLCPKLCSRIRSASLQPSPMDSGASGTAMGPKSASMFPMGGRSPPTVSIARDGTSRASSK